MKYLVRYHIILLLYINSEHGNDVQGHWTLMTKVKRDDGYTIVEFMDPYGLFPDDELNFYTDNWRHKSGQDYNILTKLLYDFSLNPKHKIYYNELKLQIDDPTYKHMWTMVCNTRSFL